MKRKQGGILAAVGLALLGTIILVAYVQSARDDIADGDKIVKVLVVTKAIPKGTPAAEVAGSVKLKELAAKTKAPGSLGNLNGIKDLVTSVELLPGEQLLRGRFVTKQQANRGDIPPGMLEVTIAMDPQRALGGRIQAGDTVGVLLSFSTDPNTTHLQFHKVLVTRVQREKADNDLVKKDAEREKKGEAVQAPKAELLVTLALNAPSVEQVVFAAEFGTIWLSNEPADAVEGGTRVVNPGNVYG